MDRLEKILLYLEGKLTNEELSDFKEQLKIDPDLMAELDIHRLTDQVSQPDNEERFGKRLANADEFENERPFITQGTSSNRKRKYSFWILSSLAAAIIALFVILHPFELTQGEIFTEYYQPYTGYHASRLSFSDKGGNPEKAILYYLEGNYDAAYEEFMVFNSEDIEIPVIYNYYLGLTYIEKEKYNLAIEAFKNVLREEFSYSHEHAQWYLSLLYVKLGKNNLARENLLDLKLQGSVYSKRSEKILQKLPR